MKSLRNPANLKLTVLVLCTLPLIANGTTYRYDPNVVKLTGVLDTRIYPGAPNYESVKNGDRPNKIWLVRLPHPIAMDPDPVSLSEKETGIKEIHVILTDLKGEKVLKKHKGEVVTLTGKIFHANTIHHPLTLLMDVQEYELHTPQRPD